MSKAGYSSVCEWASWYLFEGLNRKELVSLGEEGIFQQTIFDLELHLFPGSPAAQPTLQNVNLPNLHSHLSQYFKITPPSSLSYTYC